VVRSIGKKGGGVVIGLEIKHGAASLDCSEGGGGGGCKGRAETRPGEKRDPGKMDANRGFHGGGARGRQRHGDQGGQNIQNEESIREKRKMFEHVQLRALTKKGRSDPGGKSNYHAQVDKNVKVQCA